MITDKMLINLAGKGAYERGRDYFNRGLVVDWSQSGKTITAEVDGSELYHVTLKLTSRQLDGFCNCPASDGFDFCKHCVAVALTVEASTAGEAKGASSTQGKPLERLAAYLNKFNKQQLTEELVNVIVGDKFLLESWLLRADVAAGTLDKKALKKRLTAAIPINKHLYRYEQVRAYFAMAGAAVEGLSDPIQSLPAEQGLALLDYALSRVSKALDTIDDSGGYRFELVGLLMEVHHHCLQQVEWPAKRRLDYVLGLEQGEAAELFEGMPLAFDWFLANDGLVLLQQQYQEQWALLPPLAPFSDWDKKYPYLRLRDVLLALQGDDADYSVELLKKTATEVRDCTDICQRLIDLDDWPEALGWLNKAE